MPTRIDSPLLFPGEKVKYMNLVAFARDHWKPALEGAGLEHRGLYSLRHTFASWLIAEGLNTFQVSRALGTGIENVDLQYGHLLNDSDDALFGAMNRFDAERLDARLTQDASEETG